VGQANERSKFTGNRIVQPGVQVTNTTPCNQSTEALEQTVANSQPLVFLERYVQSRLFVTVELMGWPEAEPPQAEPFDPLRPSTPPTRPHTRFWRWARTSPRDQRTVHERSTAGIAELSYFSVELENVRAARLPPSLEIHQIRQQRW
jgi:hypothetical protein